MKIDSIAFLLSLFFGSMGLTTTAHDDEDRSNLPRDLPFGSRGPPPPRRCREPITKHHRLA
jgi:hypothetical protein